MPVNATSFLTEQNLPLQRGAPYFEETAGKGQPVEIEAPRPRGADNENLDKLKAVLAENNITLKFSRDESTKSIVVELVDNKTGEAIRQIPSTVSLTLAAHFVKLQGQFIDEK